MEKFLTELSVAQLVVGTLLFCAVFMYFVMLVSNFSFRMRFIRKYQAAFLRIGCRLESGHFLNPLNIYVKVSYQGRTFSMMEAGSLNDPDIEGVMRTALKGNFPWYVFQAFLPEGIPGLKKYSVQSGYLVWHLEKEQMKDLSENPTKVMDFLLERAQILEARKQSETGD